MSRVATCTETWQTDPSGYLLCPGEVQVRDADPNPWPGLTYEDANQVLAAALFVFALAWVIRRILHLLR